ncbi:MAG: type II toxin-antitoxin system HicB family antitoxin [Chitinivibrionales bacterium]|nr:type II toxin-antitoxin system HicB family antitoxin [Chitinivibrionales bacterium]
MNTKYEIIMYWSNDDGLYIVEVPELPGCIAHGNTQEDALKNIQEAMMLWLDTAQEAGRQIPQPKGRRLMYA